MNTQSVSARADKNRNKIKHILLLRLNYMYWLGQQDKKVSIFRQCRRFEIQRRIETSESIKIISKHVSFLFCKLPGTQTAKICAISTQYLKNLHLLQTIYNRFTTFHFNLVQKPTPTAPKSQIISIRLYS